MTQSPENRLDGSTLIVRIPNATPVSRWAQAHRGARRQRDCTGREAAG
jgi:hypothetical protein